MASLGSFLLLASFVVCIAWYQWPGEKIFDEIYYARAGEEYLAGKEIFERTRVNLEYDTVIGNIRTLARLRQEMGRKRPKLILSFVRQNNSAIEEEQAFIHDEKGKSVAQAVKEAEGKIGAPVKIAGFVRYALGEGIEKQESDFAAEVAAASGKK